MKVLILGASGFIGFPVAQALVRAGHEVIGTSRKRDNVQLFEREESELNSIRDTRAQNLRTLYHLPAVTPLIVDPTKDDSWTKEVDTLDAVIDALGGSTPIAEQAIANVRAAEKAAKNRSPSAAKLTYIWTSGGLE